MVDVADVMIEEPAVLAMDASINKNCFVAYCVRVVLECWWYW